MESAVQFFAQNNPDSPELNRVRQLLQIGTKKMEEHFIETLRRNSKAPAPETTLQLFEKNIQQNPNIPRIDSTEGPRPVPVAKFEPRILNELVKVAQWLTNDAKADTYAAHYGQIRGNVVLQTIAKLREYIKTQGLPNSLQKGMKVHKSLGRKQR